MDTPDASRSNLPSSRAGGWLPGLAVSSAVSAYVLIVFGSHVRVSDSGMGCHAWLPCDGNVGPIYEFTALMQQMPRYIAVVVTLLAVATALHAWRARPRNAAVLPALFT